MGRRRRRLWAVVGLLLLGLALGFTTPATADLKLPRPRAEAPMRFLHVTSSDPACAPDCPEWLSAEGRIGVGTADAFAKAISDLKGRRLPILLSSRGGSLRDAIGMGLLIREKRLAVAIARTLIAGCPDGASDCLSPQPRGQAITGGAVCASACPLVLAGGVERLVGPTALVGVHQITTIVKEAEGVAGLTTTRKLYEEGRADATVQSYLGFMGIGDPVMTLLRKTPAASVRWLSPEEIAASGLATDVLDAAEPILATGANGLNGRTFGGEPAGVFTARGPLETAGGVVASLDYRRGGGALELFLSPASGEKAPPGGWSVALGDGAPIVVPRAGHAIVPRQRLCSAGSFGLAPVASGPSGDVPKPAVFRLAAMDGGAALIDEACP